MPIISGKAYWAKLENAVNKFDPDKPRWSIDVALDKKGSKTMKSEGYNVRNKDDDRGDFIHIYKNKYIATGPNAGTALPKPRLFDAEKNIISGILIGNGSTVNVSYRKKEYNVGGNEGQRPELRDVQLIDLIEYSPPDEFQKEKGYVTTRTAAEEAVVIEEDNNIPF